eukprot:695601-Rhodomonas_salina.1
MRLFAKYPAKDGSQIKKDLTASRVEAIRKGIPDKNPAQAGFSVEPGSNISVRFEDLRDVRGSKELAAMLVAD